MSLAKADISCSDRLNADNISTYVTENFEVDQLGPNFDCSRLNTMRSKGVFSGKYSCLKKTVEIGSAAATLGHVGVMELLLLVVALVYGLCS